MHVVMHAVVCLPDCAVVRSAFSETILNCPCRPLMSAQGRVGFS